MSETILKTVRYLGDFNMDGISFGAVNIFAKGDNVPLHMITCTYKPRPEDRGEPDTDFRRWNDEQWYQHIKAYFEKYRLYRKATIVSVDFRFLMNNDYLTMYGMEWTDVYFKDGFNRLIQAPLRDGPASDVYLLPGEIAKLHDINSYFKMCHNVWKRERIRYEGQEGISSLPLILYGSDRIDLIRQHADRFY
jgi:hypothetical protein